MADRRLDVLFVNPNSSFRSYQGLAKDYAAVEVPTWALLLAQSCRSRGFGAAILDCNALRINDTTAAAVIRSWDPKLVCFVVYGSEPNAGTKNMSGAVSLADHLQQMYPNRYKVGVVGSHAQALPLDVLKHRCFDIVFTNEGVYALNALLTTDLSEPAVSHVYGIGWKSRTGSIQISHLNPPSRIVPQDRMDEDLPGYAWDLLPSKKTPLDLYRTHFWHAGYNHDRRSPAAAIYTSLGCPFRCSFCMINTINRNSNREDYTAADSAQFRYWSADHTISQITWLAENGIRNIRFSDEMFFLKLSHYGPLLDLVRRRYGDSLNFWAYARVDTVNPRHLSGFRQSGVRWLCLGIESADRTIRREVSKGSYEEVDVRQVVKEVEAAGIEVIANYIFGLPEDDYDTMNQTLDLSIELNTAMWNAYPCMALPGSPLYRKAKEDGTPLPTSYEGYSFHGYDCLPLPTKHLLAAEVLRFRDNAFHLYWSRPEFLMMLERKFGFAARLNVEEMLKVRLRRKILGDKPPEDL